MIIFWIGCCACLRFLARKYPLQSRGNQRVVGLPERVVLVFDGGDFLPELVESDLI